MPPKRRSAPKGKEEKDGKEEEEEEVKGGEEDQEDDQGDDKGDDKEEETTEKVSASKKIKKEGGGKKEPTGASYKGLTFDEYKQYKENIAQLGGKSQNELKETLKKNDQKITGTKKELIERVAEGKVLGRLPKCSKCGGGRLKYDIKKGQYSCPGYMEDTKFVHCKTKYTKDEIKRESWED